MEEDSQIPPLTGEAEDPLIGKVLHERFHILERIGAGGVGRVYKALQMPLERPVAIKILNARFGAGKDPNFQKRFFLEASITAKLQHPNTIKIIDYGKLDGELLFLAMEYLEGQTLSELITTEGPIPWPRALQIAQQMARSLREAHRMGVVHRDLKPANVMILREDSEHDIVKVLDFGLVKAFASADGQPAADREITKTGMLLGSPQYMSPEQAKNQSDPRSDVYSMGAVLYHLLSGRPPFTGRDSIDIIVKHMQQPVTPLKTLRPDLDIPPEIDALVLKMLEKSPAVRFQSMDDVLEAMKRASLAMGMSGIFQDVRSPTSMHSLPSRSQSRQLDVSLGDYPIGRIHPTRSERMPSQEHPTSPSMRSYLTQVPPQSKAASWVTGLFATLLVLGAGFVFVWTLNSVLKKQGSFGGAQVTPMLRAEEEAVRPRPLQPSPVAAPTPAPTTPPARAPLTATAPPAARAPSYLLVNVETVPPGARISLDGTRQGETPLELRIDKDSTGWAHGSLQVTLSGYQTETIDIRERGDTTAVIRKLTRKKSSRPSRAPASTTSPDGYKENPYE